MDDEALARVNKGRMAQLLHGNLEEVIEQTEYEIISRLISQYRAGTLTDHQLRGSIGEIAGIRALLSHLDGAARRGLMAAEDTVDAKEN